MVGFWGLWTDSSFLWQRPRGRWVSGGSVGRSVGLELLLA